MRSVGGLCIRVCARACVRVRAKHTDIEGLLRREAIPKGPHKLEEAEWAACTS